MQAAVALVSLALGNWQVSFDETKAHLDIAQTGGAVRVSGTLGFASE